MSDLLLYVLPALATGFVIGWIVRGYLTAAQSQLTHVAWCARCGRLDGSHTTACERARLDEIVPPLRGRKFSARGQDGSSLTPPVRRSDRRG